MSLRIRIDIIIAIIAELFLLRGLATPILAVSEIDERRLAMLLDLVWNGFKYAVVWPSIIAWKIILPC